MKKSILLLLLALVAYGISSINSKDSADEKDIQNNVSTSAKGSKSQKVDSTISYELPAPLTNRQEQIVEHTGYTLSYNKDHNTPNWSAWMLTKEKTEGTVERCRKFWADTKISQLYRVDYFDYKGSGYDRGHISKLCCRCAKATKKPLASITTTPTNDNLCSTPPCR